MQTITDYEIVDYGIEHESYFNGHSVAFTRFNDGCEGIGEGFQEALADALENAATQGFEIVLSTEDAMSLEVGNCSQTASQCHAEHCEQEDHSDCNHSLWYYVGLRWRTA